jgi:hypothetical protein
MLRAFFLAIGMSAFILGLEAMAIEKAVLNPTTDAGGQTTYREIKPAEWAPWSLLSGGAVVMLYSFTIPAKMRG